MHEHCRVVCLALLSTCMGFSYFVEQPGGSLFRFYPAVEWLLFECPAPVPWLTFTIIYVNQISYSLLKHINWPALQAYRISWWMMHWGSRSPKRHTAIVNNKKFVFLNRGRLTKVQRERLAYKGTSFKPTRRYHSREGRPRWNGTKQLKETQTLSFIAYFVCCLGVGLKRNQVKVLYR